MKASKGAFFAVDQRTWAKLPNLGMNEAVAYLVLAQGTGGNHKATSWSVNSLKKYAGISWERGKAAIENLKAAGFLRLAEKHTSEKPRYELPTYAELVERQTPKMTPLESRLVDGLQLGIQPSNRGERTRAENLLARCLLVRDTQGLYRLPEPLTRDPGENLIWLPNTIVTGTKCGEEPPVRRLRAAGDIWALRLFVDLYSAHNLRDNGGISPTLIWQKFERTKVGEQGPYTLWGFRKPQSCIRWNGPLAIHRERPKTDDADHPVWESIGLLQNLGLLAFVPHLFENSSPQAETIHPFGTGNGCEDGVEAELGQAANAAARAMCHPAKLAIAEKDGYEYFCPALHTRPDVQLIGVARLRYRPHTRRTAAWYGELQQNAGGYIEIYRQLAEQAEAAAFAREVNFA